MSGFHGIFGSGAESEVLATPRSNLGAARPFTNSDPRFATEGENLFLFEDKKKELKSGRAESRQLSKVIQGGGRGRKTKGKGKPKKGVQKSGTKKKPAKGKKKKVTKKPTKKKPAEKVKGKKKKNTKKKKK